MQVIADLKALWPLRDFRKLFAVRLVSQTADGMSVSYTHLTLPTILLV